MSTSNKGLITISCGTATLAELEVTTEDAQAQSSNSNASNSAYVAAPIEQPGRNDANVGRWLKLRTSDINILAVLYGVAGIIVAACARGIEIGGVGIKQRKDGSWVGSVKCGIPCEDDSTPCDKKGAIELLFLCCATSAAIPEGVSTGTGSQNDGMLFDFVINFLLEPIDVADWKIGEDTEWAFAGHKDPDFGESLWDKTEDLYWNYCTKCAEKLVAIESDMIGALVQALQAKHRIRRSEVDQWLNDTRHSALLDCEAKVEAAEADIVAPRTHEEQAAHETRITAHAIVARAYNLPIQHLHSQSSWEDIFGDNVPLHVRVLGLMVAEYAAHGTDIDFHDGDHYELYDAGHDLAPRLWQDYDETDLTVYSNLLNSFWFTAKRLLAQNSCALKTICAKIRGGISLSGEEADRAVDTAMSESKCAVKDLEFRTGECCEYKAD